MQVYDKLFDRIFGVSDMLGSAGGQIKQLKGAKFEANLVFQNAIDGGEICNAFRHDAQRLSAVPAACMVNDKARGVIGLHGRMPHLFGKLSKTITDFRISFESSNDFNHFHQRYRVEEVETDYPLWVLEL